MDILLGTGRAVVLWTAFVVVFTSTFGWSRYHRVESVAAGPDERPVVGPTRLQNSGRSWTDADDAVLTAFVNGMVPLKTIAARMERTVPAIRTRMAKLKLRFPEA
jgi:hypothetical protein